MADKAKTQLAMLISCNSYNPIFMNDAMHDQNVLKSYGSQNFQRLKKTHQQYDVDGFLSRQNGFKFDD